VSADRSTHTVEELFALLDTVFAGERDRSSAAAASWWDRFYRDPDQPAPFLTDAPDENLARWIEHGPLPGRGHALDLGCGIGRNAVYLARRGLTVDAVDLSPVAIARTRDLAQRAGVTVNGRALDVFATPDSGRRYDLVHDSGLFHHLPPHRRLSHLALLDTVLVPGGYFSLTCFGAAPAASEVPDAELYRTGDLGGGLSYPADALRSIFGHLEEIELRPMRDQPTDSQRFGEPFLWAALFRRPDSAPRTT
jgi:SAM-dependent methyltransferase